MNASAPIPDKPALEGLEAKWGETWEVDGTHRFDRAAALAAGKVPAQKEGGDAGLLERLRMTAQDDGKAYHMPANL